MPDATTKTPTKADVEEENARLRALLEANDIDPDSAAPENEGIVGNLADLQRLGALAVSSGKTSVDEAIVPFKPESMAEVSEDADKA